MVASSRVRGVSRLILGLVAALAPAALLAADAVKGTGKFNSQHETVEVFAAIEAGQVEAQLIAKDSTQACLRLTNKAGKPLNVQMPATLAAVPVLAQFNFPNNPGGGINNAGAPQPLGLGNPMMNNNPLFNAGNPGGPFNFAAFNLAPEQVAQVKLPAVCLEHGKPEPKPQIAYQVRPLESVSDKPAVQELCAMLGRGEIPQRAAQAATWHLNNDLSWKQLKAERIKFAFGRLSEPYFSARELAQGQKAAEKAMETVKAAQSPPGKSNSATP